MPELPEVEVSKEALIHLIGSRLVKVRKIRALPLRKPMPDLEQYDCSTLKRVYRRGKYILMKHEFKTVAVHFGMTGMLYLNQTGPYDLISFLYEGPNQSNDLVYSDIRRFGSIEVLLNNQVDKWLTKLRLGQNPLIELDRGLLRRQLLGSRQTIKDWLLDQSNFAGIGNIYACEILYACGINPMLSAALVTPNLDLLIEKTRMVLLRAIQAGGSSISNFKSPLGVAGTAQDYHKVYGKEGESCECGDTICREFKGRSTYWCPTCQ